MADVAVEAPFDEAEQLLLDEARERFAFEQKSTDSLHSRSVLFLTLTGGFTAVIASFMARAVERAPKSPYLIATQVIFATSLILLGIAAVRLAQHAVSRSYQVIATPAQWREHLAKLRQRDGIDPDGQARTAARLKRDLLDAWSEAADVCYSVNQKKADVLERVSVLLRAAILLAIVGAFILQVNTVLSR